MLRKLGLFAVALAQVTCSSTPPVGTCSADADCTGGRCLNKECFKRSCDAMTCGLGQVCQSESCVDELCVNLTCSAGSVCLMGSCLATSCTTKMCGENQVCSNETCVDVCLGVLCPAGQSCMSGACVGATACAGVTCTGDQICDTGVCVEPACVGVHCDAGVCSQGQCMDSACVGVQCDGGVCSQGQCIDSACVNVHCDGGVCQGGACVAVCDVSCAAPCPTCANGRACGGALECQSLYCPASGRCAACDNTTNTCPNGGLCMNGTCKSGLNGPCLATVDCEAGMGFVCDTGECRLGQGGTCSTDTQCISTLQCVDLICQRPKCIMQNLETQMVPGNVFEHGSMAAGVTDAGEIFVTHGQWTMYNNTAIRRFRVAPGLVQEQDPQPPATLLNIDANDPVPHGHADVEGTAATSESAGKFFWYAAGGPFDGLKTVELDFTGFNGDVEVNDFNEGRFAKCGQNFVFFESTKTSTKVMLLFTTPSPVGSGTTAQIMMVSTKRYDGWTYPTMLDIACDANFIYVLGAEQGVMKLQRIDFNLAPVGNAVEFTTAPGNQPGDDDLVIVDDTLQFVVNGSGNVLQVHNDVVSKLSNITYGAYAYLFATHDDLIVYQAGPNTPDSTVVRWGRREMDGTVPPLDLDCQWQ